MRSLFVLLWKNLIVTKRKPLGFVIQIIYPLIYMILLYVIKHKLKPKVLRFDVENMMKYTVEKFPEITSSLPNCLLYTPNTELAGTLMDEVGRQLGLSSLTSIPRPDEVRFKPCLGYYPFSNYYEVAHLVRKFHGNDAIIVFENMDAEAWSSRAQDSLTYTIRMKKDFSTHVITSHGHGIPRDHSEYGDVYNGFTRIQWAIDTSYIKIRSGTTVRQKLSLQEFPYYRRSAEQALMAYVIVGLVFACCWLGLMNLFLQAMNRMLIDRVTGIQEVIKLNGVSVFTLGASHFISALPPALLFAVVSTVLLKTGDPSIIEHTGAHIILIGMTLYVVSIIACGMACSYITNNSQYSSLIGIFVYIATVVAARLLTDQASSPALRVATGLMLHVPFHWMLLEIASFEAIGKPLTFSDISTSHATTQGSVLFVYIFLSLQSIIFLIIAWYMSHVRRGQYGNFQPWNFCYSKGFWTGKEEKLNYTSSKHEVDLGREEKYFEKPPSNLDVGIKIINVSKIYPKHNALNDVSLNVYKGEITILWGHNGAGKTTLMSIITGMTPATQGVVYVNGVDSRSHGIKVRRQIGLCPQHNLFIPKLNVLEHVIFFHLLKIKCSIKEARANSIALLDQLGIGDKLFFSPEDLSGGMKRRLQLACALTGGVDVLVLDEPTTGLDVETRRELWNLLLSLRGGHTVLLSTHFIEEADALGDRIAALHTGHLRCHATPMYLKKVIGTGYRLSITTNGIPNESEITRVIRSHVSDATVKEKTATSITYNLPTSATSKFPALFAALEKDTKKKKCCILPPKDKRGALGIVTIGLGVTTLEEAFLKLCSDTEIVDEHELDCTDEAAKRDFVSGAPLYKRQVVALIRRYFKFVKSSWFSFFLYNIIFPWVVMYRFLDGTNNTEEALPPTEPDLAVALSMYHSLPERRVLLNVNTSEKVSRRMMDENADVMFFQSSNINDDLLAVSIHNMVNYNNYVIGVELDDQHAKALYTTVHRHAAPAAVNLLSNALASHYLAPPEGGDRLITVHNHPLERAQLAEGTKVHKKVKSRLLCYSWAIIVCCMIQITIGNFLKLPILDRQSGARHMHVMAGCPAALHWLTSLAVHTALVTVMMVPAVVFCALVVDTDDTLGKSDILVILTIIIILGTVAFLSLLYVLTLSFAESTVGIMGLMMVLGFGCFVPLVKLSADILKNELSLFENAIFWIGSILIPPQTMTVAASKAVYARRLNALCEVNKANCPNIAMEDTPGFNSDKCCAGKTSPYFAFNEYSPGTEILTMIAQGIVYMIIVIKIQQGYFDCLYDRIRNTRFEPDEEPSPDELVFDESKYVNSEILLTKSSIQADEEAILVNDLHKNFPNLLRNHMYAVRGINFSVKRGECFGLLGTNGAGKSTTFKMLTAEVCPTKGIIYANQYFLHEDKKKYLRTIGYCPQFLGIDEFQTANDNLKTLLTIRGLHNYDIDKEVKTWIDIFGLKRYKNTIASQYSGGYKRRLAAALALCAGAPLSLLDEPTAGVDVGARRRVHAALKKSLCQNRSIVITSHSMDEMESLCARIAIMVAGKIRALGTPAELRSRFTQGYTVIFKITSYLTESERSVDDRVGDLKKTMQKKFDCELKDEHMTMLHYHMTDKVSYSELFQQLELIRNSYLKLIEDYSVSETTLEEVFLHLAKAGTDKDLEPREDLVKAECGLLSCIGNKVGLGIKRVAFDKAVDKKTEARAGRKVP